MTPAYSAERGEQTIQGLSVSPVRYDDESDWPGLLYIVVCSDL